jgi:Flp pilus assembly protein TadB
VRPLYTTAVGIGMLVGFVVFIAVGILWMRKLVNVEV